MAAPTAGSRESSKSKEKRLPFSKLLILYFISKRGKYESSILQLSRDMGYPTDSNVNKNFNELVRDGYLLDKPVFKLTKTGEAQLQFSRLPDYLLGLLLAIGVVVISVSVDALLGLGPINPTSTFSIGIAIVTVSLLFFRVKRITYDDFLGLRKPLSPTESSPIQAREPDSAA